MAYESPVDMFLYINTFKKTDDKIAFIKSRIEKDPIFSKLLKIAFDPQAKLYTTKVPRWLKKDNNGANFSNLRAIVNKLPPLSKAVDLPKQTKDNILINLLESIDLTEAEFLVKVITQKVEIEGLNYTNINKAVPGFLSER